jgi:hypothetical protein
VAVEIERPMRAKGMVHKDLAGLAKEMAAAHYEVLAKDNRFYKQFPKQAVFVRKCWIYYVAGARDILVGMLGDANRPEAQRQAIMDCILKDAAINPKRKSAPEKPRFFTGPNG